ncbi:hypothetical protein L914_14701 [Phytophthora nicotianae]|uniref:Uncharacterized protein n=3 Tax=Phytophthora nicotianae TaxID=4792 RepID=V9EIR3_PHYNI|nr:hypothetical protein F443_15304 [Phytophthora nicotianae P1569]ETM39125.1 hypothetical protein L914_14701 [Phytophthora nicotianae]ETO67815.1 hypothetical protein F444_15297 [Phytophthora nicotianae P1976]
MVHVVSCRFLRLGCSEEEHPLFKREYARSNLGRGVKLLRCFPHCCPGHIERSYCGCSVHLLVTFSEDVSSTVLDELLVCTRFEPSHVAPLWSPSLVSLFRDAGAGGDEDKGRHEIERSLQIGESVTLSEEWLPEQPNEDAVWLRAKREMQQGHPKNAALYVINSHTPPKWFYNYDSGTSREHREMTHHFVVYVFQLHARKQQPGGYIKASVLARHASLAFSLVSSRRSTNHRNADLPASDIPGDNMGGDEQQHKDAEIPPLKNIGSAEFLEQGLHILILWKFFKSLKRGDIEFSTSRVGLYVRSYLIRAAGLRGTPPVSSTELENAVISLLNDVLGNSFYPPIRIPSATSVDTGVHLDQERGVSRVIVHLFLRVLSSTVIQWHLNSAFIAARDMTSKSVLNEHFVSLVSIVYDVFDSLVRELPYDAPFGDQYLTLPILVDDVLSVVYDRDSFNELRSEISALLEWKENSESLLNALSEIFQVYVAQAREATISLTSQVRNITQGPTNHGFRQRWMLLPESTQTLDLSSGRQSSGDYRVVDIAQFMYEFSCVDVSLGETDCCLSFRSVFPVLPNTTRAPTTLILDGQLRVFRVLPSGISSMIATAGGWCIGDYTGTVSSDGQSLDVSLFGFAEGYHPSSGNEVLVARLVNLTLKLEKGQSKTEQLKTNVSTMSLHAVVYGSAHKPPKGNHISVSEWSTTDRAVLWDKLQWTPMVEMQTTYVAV